MITITSRFGMVFLLGCSLAVDAHAEGFDFKLIAASAESYAKPHDIVLSPDGKFLYVADNDNDRIAVLDSQSLRELGIFAEGEVSAPHDVVFDAEGRLLVADTGNSRIAIYEVQGTGGKLVESLSGSMRRPEGVAVHPDGRVFATGAASHNLVVFRGAREVAQLGGFSSPHDVELDPSGGIWVADAANDRMVRLNEALEVTAVLSGPSYAFSGPRYMDFDASDHLFVADKYTHRIKVIGTDGTLIQVLGEERSGKGEGVFDRPEGVEISGNDIWISDTYNDRIVRYRFTSKKE